MGTTNILQWNPGALNQEDDAAYLADSMRAAGASNPSVFEPSLANKAFFQWSAVAYALCTAFANNGLTMLDSNIAQMIANFQAIQVGAPRALMTTVAYAASVTFNCAASDGFEVTLAGNITSLAVTGAVFGQVVKLVFVQTSGGATVAFSGNVESPGTPDTTASATSVQLFVCLSDGNLHPISGMTVS